MIDFRYHIVSIVSIFMALAVGIVLGAGPLKGSIGDTLTQEVTQLRDDRAALRTELDAARKGATARDDFTRDAATRLVGGVLTGSAVALVVLPSADADHVSEVTEPPYGQHVEPADLDVASGQLHLFAVAHALVGPLAVDLDGGHRRRHLAQRPGERGDACTDRVLAES